MAISRPGSSLASKLNDALAKLDDAMVELAKTPPDRVAALGKVEGALGELEDAVKDSGLNNAEGTRWMDQLAGSARQLAGDALNRAIAQCPNDSETIQAQQALAQGDALRSTGKFKEAVDRYRQSLSKAESACS